MKRKDSQPKGRTTAIAIDGPAGAGKSTIAWRAAEALGFLYVDTGSLYRAIALFVLKSGVNPSSPAEVCPLLKTLSVALNYENGNQKVSINGEDVTGQIRSAEVSMAASKVSAIPEVRKYLLALQRRLAEEHSVVMDGRDIGTVVLPNARVKIFLTASADERARRRYEEMIGKGMKADYEEVLSDLKQRDYKDEHRAISPLRQAEDAVLIDTTGNTLEQSVAELTHIIRSRLAGK